MPGFETPLLHYIGYLLVAAILGGIVGAFFSQKAKPFRRYLFFVILAIIAVWALLTRSSTGYLVAFFAAAVATWLYLRVSVTLKAGDKSTAYGSAEWANFEHLREHNLIGASGLSLGAFEAAQQGHRLHYTGQRHLLTVAPTRSGKGVSAIIPNLLTYEGSAVVIDPKGENAMITSARRGQGERRRGIAGLGQRVYVVDPWGITGQAAARFNPLDWLRSDDPDISENAMMLADSIVIPGSGKDRFWDEEAKALLMGLLLYVALDPREHGTAEKPTRNLGRVRDIIVGSPEQLKQVLQQMFESTNPVVKSTAARTAGKAPDLRANVLAALQSHTHFLDSPRIRGSLAQSDFRFEELKETPTSIYLVLPSDRLETFGRWLRLLIQQAITVSARNIQQKPAKPILFLLDEMPTLGRLTMVEQAYGLMAGFGMQLWGIVQDLSQLERIYEKGWETFIGNSGVIQYFGSRDQKTAEYFSKLCGVTTIEKMSVTRSIAEAIGFSGGQRSDSTTDSYGTTLDVVQRHLAFPDELMVLRDEKQLVFVENFNPIPARRVKWFEDDRTRALGVNLHAEVS